MKILVIIKETPDTESKITLSGDKTAVETGGLKYIINPYDEFAIEEALQIKAKNAGSEVVIASFANEKAKERIIKALAMGADRGVLVNNAGLENADSLTAAKVLAALVKEEAPQVVLCGKQAIDDDNMHVGPMVAELMNWPHVNVVNSLTVDGETAKAERAVEGGQVEVYDVKLPAIFGADKALNTPRYASLPGIMKAKKKPFDLKQVSDLGLSEGDLSGGIKFKVTGFEYPAEKPPGKVFKDEEVGTMVEKVVNLLREEAKVI